MAILPIGGMERSQGLRSLALTSEVHEVFGLGVQLLGGLGV